MSTSVSPQNGSGRIRVLIVAEAVTLAHVARPAALAARLNSARFDVHFARAPRFDTLLGNEGYIGHAIESISVETFLDRAGRAAPLHSTEDLRRYVREDLALISRVNPDVVVGDFRLSLSVSARIAQVPYAAIANVYWSPHADQRFPVPEGPFTRRMGVGAGRVVFPLVRRLGFALHTIPLNRVRREHGLASLGLDLRRTYTDGDWVLYADAPELAPSYSLAPRHRFLGPVLWSPSVPEPDWWHELPADRPVVYVTFGSSGPRRLLETALEGLSALPVTVIAAAGRSAERLRVPANTFVADFLDGEAACRRAAAVVCNGGSPTVQQAVSAGRPVLGVAWNLDQHLMMAAVNAAGVGLSVRSEHATPRAILDGVCRLLDGPVFRTKAEAVGRRFAIHDAAANLGQAIEEMATG